MDQGIETPSADVLLIDGSIAAVRGLQRADARELFDLLDQASDDSSRRRFFGLNRASGHAYASGLLDAQPETSIALVAYRHGKLVGLASAEVSGPEAEVSFLVADDVHGLGLGSLLLEHLAAMSRARGITTFTAEVLTENHPMLRVFADAGFVATKRSHGASVSWTISTSPSDSALAAADRRERTAETKSLSPLLYPRSVAVIGVRRDGAGIGNAVLSSITHGGFTGDTYVVHPSATDVGGVATYSSLKNIPAHIDVAVVTVPAEHALETVWDAATAGVSAVVIVTSGFGELGATGRTLQANILQVARDHDMRIVGPNCLGLLCNDEAISLHATFSSSVPPPGGLAIASQSGGVGIALLDRAKKLGLGVQSFVSLGNQPDVSGTDLLAAWRDDPRVVAAALYLESFGNPRKFARLARNFSERKPLLAVVGGRSVGGARAGASHTAAAATPVLGIEAIFAQAGVIHCRSAEELVHTARVLTEQPLPQGPRVAILSNAGGIGILAADCAADLGLDVPELSDELKAKVERHLSGTIGFGNPIDLGASASSEDTAAVIKLLVETGEVDAVLAAIIPTSVADPTPLVTAVNTARRADPDRPVLLVAMGGLRVPPGALEDVTVFDTPEDALGALGHVVRYAAWRASPRDPWVEDDQDRAYTARVVASRLVAEAPAAGQWLAVQAQEELLGPFGISPVGEVANGPAEAVDAADRIGYPVAIKVADPNVVHKTDRGLVRVGVNSPSAVGDAVEHFSAELNTDSVEILVQPVLTGVELALGLVRHPTFGPLVMVAAGGVATAILADQAFLMPPITTRDANRALMSLRTWPLLQGYRGSAPVDLSALERLIVNLGHLADDVPEIVELDMNPVLASTNGVTLVDIKVRLKPTTEPSGSLARQLSSSPARVRPGETQRLSAGRPPTLPVRP